MFIRSVKIWLLSFDSCQSQLALNFHILKIYWEISIMQAYLSYCVGCRSWFRVITFQFWFSLQQVFLFLLDINCITEENCTKLMISDAEKRISHTFMVSIEFKILNIHQILCDYDGCKFYVTMMGVNPNSGNLIENTVSCRKMFSSLLML